ncbi:MAG: response regulator transcription factor [Vicinamibacteraceae bacterium]
MSGGPHILVVEDDRVVAETLRLYLEHAGYRVTTVHDGPSGAARAGDPDVAAVILDWLLPAMSGYEVCRTVRSRSTVPILMLTARTTEDDRVRGLECGADDYVGKPFSPREVVARVQALLRRATAPATLPPPPTRAGALEVDHFRREVRVNGAPVALTATELKLIEALAGAPGRTFTREELVARAFGPDYDGLDRTVDTHVTNLRRKLQRAGCGEAIATVHGVGYRLTIEIDRA